MTIVENERRKTKNAEEGGEQKFEISSDIVLNSGKACIAGANMVDNLAKLLIVKADIEP